MFKNYLEYIEYLKSIANVSTAKFNKKLIATKFGMLGAKIPDLRLLAKKIAKDKNEELILANQNFEYYEEILVYGFVLAQLKIEESLRIEKIKSYIQVFDNWSVVDCFCASVKSVSKNKDKYLKLIRECLKSKNDFVVRFAIILIMDYYLDEENLSSVLSLALTGQKDSYYIEMAIAWLFATGLAKHFNESLDFLKSNKNDLSDFIKRKTISKCNDSFRLDNTQKEIIKQVLS